MLQATQERCRELGTEAVVLTDELTRTSAVAARAAAREVVNGSKDEGVVPVTLHLEEVGQTMAVLARSVCVCLSVCLSDHPKVVG